MSAFTAAAAAARFGALLLFALPLRCATEVNAEEEDMFVPRVR